jgi:alpha-glucuronidase
MNKKNDMVAFRRKAISVVSAIGIAVFAAGIPAGLQAAPDSTVAVPAPVIEWDFQHIENSAIFDTAGKSDGRLENGTHTSIDASHSGVTTAKDPSSRVLLHGPQLSGKHFTLSLWLNIRSGPTSYRMLRSGTLTLGVYRSNARLQYRSGTKFETLNTYPDPRGIIANNDGQWHYVAASYDEVAGGNVAVYVDGQQVMQTNSESAPAKDYDSALEIEIGSDNGKGEFAGTFSDIRVFDAVLSPDQVSAIYEADKNAYGKQTAAPPKPAASAQSTPKKHKAVAMDATLSDQALHSAWLDYRPAEPGTITTDETALLQQIIAPVSDPTIQTAANELELAINGIAGIKAGQAQDLPASPGVILGTPDTSPTIASWASRLPLQSAGNQGYVLQSVTNNGTPYLVVAGNSPSGVIVGTFALIRRMQLGQSLENVSIVDAPKTSIRLVNHWDFIPNAPDASLKGRNDSIFSWADLRSGHTEQIREWIRLLASAGYNGVCPTELNWSEGNNFLSHLAEVKTLGDICRDYGVKLYWTPNYLLAPLQSTADALYTAVPDFGGYLLKFGSEGQPGDPAPKTINQIARLLAPHGGTVLVRGFIYGKFSPLQDKLRVLIPYKFFSPLDGQYDKNVVIVGKSSPLDFEIREPINPLDGMLKQTRYGSEMMIAKDFPMSWLEVWKQWYDFDNQRNGPDTFNRDGINALVGIAMINPNVSWTYNPLNMLNYYGFGRLAWDPDLTAAQVRSEWVGMTFGPQSPAAPALNHILDQSMTVADDLMLYHGYRGVWIILQGGELRPKLPYPQEITAQGIGGDGVGSGLSAAYAPGVRAFYEDKTKNEDLLLFFHFLPYSYQLSNGRTIGEDMHDRLAEGVEGSKDMLEQWKTLDGQIDPQYFKYTTACFESYVDDAQKQQEKVEGAFATLLGHPLGQNTNSLTRAN